MAVVWLTAVGMLVTACVSIFTTGARLDGTETSGDSWRIVMVLVTLVPWLPYGALPLVQRRHLTRPQPFYAYCRWASILTATAGPVLLVTTWALGPGTMWGMETSVLFAMVLYCFVFALYPYAARRNHAAWLRAQNVPPPY